jgi:diguanylate cyclase (GGDEF)-like protein/PAS domain S-box-containing protein
VIVRDVTDHNRAVKELKWERDFVSAVLDTADALVVVRDREGRIIQFNSACESITGYSSENVKNGKVWDLLLDASDARNEKKVFSELLEKGEAEAYQNHWLSRSGEQRKIKWSLKVLRSEEDAIEHVISTGVDITEQTRAEAKIRFLAYYDALTELPNRALFAQQLDRTIEKASPVESLMAVMFLDLDRFKIINDTFGHPTGDRLIKQVAERLSQCVRRNDHVGRLSHPIGRFGGDEFTVLLTGLNDSNDAAKVARRIMEVLSAPFTVHGQKIFVTASLGISLYPTHGADSDTLLKNADIAMYHAKDVSTQSYGFFSESMLQQSAEKFSLGNDLHEAIKRQDFVLHYQPQIDSSTEQMVGAEALLRWQHPTKGLLYPNEFILLAEETGLILPIDEWVLRAACSQILEWQKAGIPATRVSVNLSSLQLRSQGFLATLKAVLDETHVDPGLLELEITESAIMHPAARVSGRLAELKDLGISLSIDDFGTGYSSLSYLKRFPVDTLKIDRSFVRELADDPDDRAITAAIVAMAHNLDLKVVAEGVETEEQLKFLKSQGCDMIQGWLYSRAVTPDDLTKLICSGDTRVARRFNMSTPGQNRGLALAH